MEALRMLQISTYLFAFTALGGIVMGWIRFSSGKNPPSWLAMGHGFLAAAGVTLLAYAVLVLEAPGTALISLLLFLLGSVGGVVLNLVYHLNDKPLPKGIVVAHALIAVIAFVLLYMAAFTGA
jgi:hypothetical protein